MSRSRVLALVIKEIKEILPPTLFFAFGFNLIELTTQLVRDDYRVRAANFLVATTAALVVGKAVLVTNLQIWIFVLFLIYTSATELNELFGPDELVEILFTRRSSGLKPTSRERVRGLVKLSRLTEVGTLSTMTRR